MKHSNLKLNRAFIKSLKLIESYNHFLANVQLVISSLTKESKEFYSRGRMATLTIK